MLFTFDPHAFESEKERNFYYKVFAGYWFNELLPGLQDRLDAFVRVLRDHCAFVGNDAPPLRPLAASSVRVSFDNHEYLIRETASDRGEFADVLIQDHSSPVVYAIEAKLFSDWQYGKDVVDNGSRLARIAELLPLQSVVPVLLVTEAKWEASKKLYKSPGSNFALLDQQRPPVRVICWEALANVASDATVQQYIRKRLRTPDATVEIRDKWFHRIL